MEKQQWLVTQIDDLSPVYWDLCIDHLHIFPTSREHRNIVQLCTRKVAALLSVLVVGPA